MTEAGSMLPDFAMVSSEEECIALASSYKETSEGSPSCLPDWDGEICWPLTTASQEVEMDCPDKPWIDASKSFYRACSSNGTWAGPGQYSDCFLDSLVTNPTLYLANISDAQLRFFERMVASSRILAIVGNSISWISLLVALCIFLHFRSLNCNRTKIHKHLFVSLLIRLTIEVIFAIDRHYSIEPGHRFNTNTLRFQPILCEIFEVLREYGRFCAFAWMFIEGMYLNSLISIAVFGKPKFLLYYLIGWVFPIPFVSAWAIAMEMTNGSRCWYPHVNSLFFKGLIEIPRNILLAYYGTIKTMASFLKICTFDPPYPGYLPGGRFIKLLINAIFLINIVRVLVTKLRESNSGEVQQVRKAVKAAIVLLPLLGIVNLLWVLPEATAKDSRAIIVICLFIFRFFAEFQGFFVALLYCFLNQEVRMVLRRKWSTWRNYRDPTTRRTSMLTSTSDIHSTRGTKPRIGSGGFEYITVTV